MVTLMTSYLMVVRTMGDTTDLITTTRTETAEWVATSTTTITVVIRGLVGAVIDTTMAVEIIVGQVVKVAATITKWIVIMVLEDTAVLEAQEKKMSLISV